MYHGGYFGMAKAEIEERADEMIEVFGLDARSATCARRSSPAASAGGCCWRAR